MSESLEGRSYLPPEEPLEKESSLAWTSLVFGILSWVAAPVFFAVPAVLLGHMARTRIARSAGRLRGDGLAVAGLLLGYANLVLAAVAAACLAGLFLIPALVRMLSR
ncbi:MAG: DUF4190 domain-containing protein [Anaerolineales bacterium]|nr:DUF4190 domain-containing protein [Anaerolineales bacterium]